MGKEGNNMNSIQNHYLDLSQNNDQSLTVLQKPAELLRNGGLVLFPTETVYGLGANGLNDTAVKRIYQAKGREADNPLILHVSDFSMLPSIVKHISPLEKKLLNAFWPGPFTLILPHTDQVPCSVTAGLSTVGVRMPSNSIARSLIGYAGVPIAAPSANVSGKPSGTKLSDIQEELLGKVDFMIDGGECDIGLESTVVQVIDNIPHLLRPGKITPDQIKSICGKVIIDPHILGKTEDHVPILSPGMKYRHYAPNTPCLLVCSDDNQKKVEKIKELKQHYLHPLILCSTENLADYSSSLVFSYGSQCNLEEVSHSIFHLLRQVDSYQPDMVFIEGLAKEGLGLAIMNRLLRACEFQVIQV